MYSDEWSKTGYHYAEGGYLSGPVSYRKAYSDLTGELLGVLVDFECADDFHYELLPGDWETFCKEYLIGKDEQEAFRAFIKKKGTNTLEGLFAFEDALNEADIKYEKIAFYDTDFDM